MLQTSGVTNGKYNLRGGHMYDRIWVTGGTGLVGEALRSIKDDYPNKEFIFSSSRDCNLTHLDNVLKYVETYKPDAIIHLAAVSGGIGLSTKYPATLLRDNVMMNMNVLEAARILGVKKTVMTLSTGMYPASIPNPILEEYIHDGYPHESNYSYSFAKRLVDPMIKAYRTEYGLNVIGLIPNGILGEYSNYDNEASAVVPALIRRFYENREGDTKIVIWGDGSPLREFTYAGDIARAYMWCLDNYNDAQVLHIGTTEECSIKDIAHMIADILGIDRSRIDFDTSKPSGQSRKSTDNSKFVQISGFRYTPFQVALQNTTQWFCDHYGDSTKVRL